MILFLILFSRFCFLDPVFPILFSRSCFLDPVFSILFSRSCFPDPVFPILFSHCVVPRINNSGCIATLDKAFRPSRTSFKSWAHISPRSSGLLSSVVSSGSQIKESGELLQPVTAISSGTRKPFFFSPFITPIAVISSPHTIPVNGMPSWQIYSAASRPPSRPYRQCTTFFSAPAISCSFMASRNP